LEPYTIEESERAAGKGSYQLPKKRKIETQGVVDGTMQKIEDEDVKMN
jgi:bud site selection protein 20